MEAWLGRFGRRDRNFAFIDFTEKSHELHEFSQISVESKSVKSAKSADFSVDSFIGLATIGLNGRNFSRVGWVTAVACLVMLQVTC